MIAQAHAVPPEAQGGDGVQEAGRQAAQTAVAQGGLRLLLLHRVQVMAPGGQQLPDLVPQTQGKQIVVQQLPHEEFRGEVVELPLPSRGRPLLGQIPGQNQQGLVQLPVAALLRRQAEPLPGNLSNTLLQIHG